MKTGDSCFIAMVAIRQSDFRLRRIFLMENKKLGMHNQQSNGTQKPRVTIKLNVKKHQNRKSVCPDIVSPSHLISNLPSPTDTRNPTFLERFSPAPSRSPSIAPFHYRQPSITPTFADPSEKYALKTHQDELNETDSPSILNRLKTMCFLAIRGSEFADAEIEAQFCKKRHVRFVQSFRYNTLSITLLGLAHSVLDVVSYCSDMLPYKSGPLCMDSEMGNPLLLFRIVVCSGIPFLTFGYSFSVWAQKSIHGSQILLATSYLLQILMFWYVYL
jgi:hypothetical protein